MNGKTTINIYPRSQFAGPLKARAHPPSHPLQTRPFPIKLQRRAARTRKRLYGNFALCVSIRNNVAAVRATFMLAGLRPGNLLLYTRKRERERKRGWKGERDGTPD